MSLCLAQHGRVPIAGGNFRPFATGAIELSLAGPGEQTVEIRVRGAEPEYV
jgi:hypothetical protein